MIALFKKELPPEKNKSDGGQSISVEFLKAKIKDLEHIIGRGFSPSTGEHTKLYFRQNQELQNRVRQIGHLLKPQCPAVGEYVRVGRDEDGGYVMHDSVFSAKTAISLGIADEVSWDLELANRGLQIAQFDFSVDSPPILHKNFAFHKSKICAAPGAGEENLQSLTRFLSPGISNILKIDIEGYEWDAFASCAQQDLSGYSQIVAEFHDLQEMVDENWFIKCLSALEKITQQFQSIHVHGNNYGRLAVLGNIAFPTALEVTFLNRSLCGFEDFGHRTYPTPMDHPNNRDFPDIYLGTFDFD
jgi:hypothetical protein